nr:hypothetical protein [Kibdelosporangium sp. MJ126-NF4]
MQRIEAGRLPWSDELSAMLDLYKVPAEKRPPFFDTLNKAWQPRPTRAKQHGGEDAES